MGRKIFSVKCSYVFTDSNGKIISDCVYEDAKFNDYFNAYKVDGKWGFINDNGENLTDVIYDKVNLIDNVAVVKNKDAYYFLNETLEKIIQDSFSGFQHVRCNNLNYFMVWDAFDHSGVYLINPDNSYEEIIPFNHYTETFTYGKYIIYSNEEEVKVLDLKSKEIIYQFKGSQKKIIYTINDIIIITIANKEDEFSSIIIAINKYGNNLIMQKTGKFQELQICGHYSRGYLRPECIVTYDGQFYKFYTIELNEDKSIYFKEIAPEIEKVQYYLRTYKDYIVFYDKNSVYYIYRYKDYEFKCVFKGIFPLFILKVLKWNIYISKDFYKKIWFKNK